MQEKKKIVLEESSKTRKTREKLKKQLEQLEKKITRQALETKTVEIHRWIARHASERIVLREKTIALFDENQNTAALSFRVALLAEQLQRGELPKGEDLADFWSARNLDNHS